MDEKGEKCDKYCYDKNSKDVNDYEFDGSCKKIPGCSEGWEENGSCKCPLTCVAGCYDNTSTCRKPGTCGEYAANNGTQFVNCNSYEYCQTDKCFCNPDHACVIKDANHNNMIDQNDIDPEVLAWNEQDCAHTSTICEKTFGSTSFCDSFIDYKCSKRCTDSSQCLDGFICRSDGRCAADSFTTVWDNSRDNRLNEINI